MSKTPRTDNIARGNHVVPTEWAEQLERELDEAMDTLTTIHRWVDKNHPGGFVDCHSFSQNLVRVADRWYERLDKMERERDEARNEIVGWKNKWDCAVEMGAQAQADHDKAREEIKELREIIEIHRQIAINYQARAVKAEEHLKTLCTANKN